MKSSKRLSSHALIASRTPAGFEVVENGGGRSSVDFDYRIVAQPIGDTSTRLAAIVPEPKLGEKPLDPRILERRRALVAQEQKLRQRALQVHELVRH